MLQKCRRLVGLLGLLALAAGTSACQASNVGHVPRELVRLYDMGTESGMIELELTRDGQILEMEVDVPISALPRIVTEAALARLPGARITGAEREVQVKGRRWEVKLLHQKRAWELIIDGKGKIHETERELKQAEAPRVVLTNAERVVPDSVFKSVEIIEYADGGSEYHVKRTRNGVSYKIVLTADGRVIRRVREHRAEIEIPLID
jgi:hypothetical protein